MCCRMASQVSSESSLLALPDTCLLAVLQCCAAEDHRSLFAAARAHSRLHQAAVLALRSITAVITKQQQVDGVLLYLGTHSEHVDSMTVAHAGDGIVPEAEEYRTEKFTLRQLPPNQLTKLQLKMMDLQLQPGRGCEGVLGAAAKLAALKQLRIKHCSLVHDFHAPRKEALAAALPLLPAGLEHLKIRCWVPGGCWVLHTGVLQRLQQLTYLELVEIEVVAPDEATPVLQPVQALTRLVDLRLGHLDTGDTMVWRYKATKELLKDMYLLTRLDFEDMEAEPDVLTGKTRLQHLSLYTCWLREGAPGQKLSQLQDLQQLTHLELQSSLSDINAPAAACAALTASSKLQHLGFSGCSLPEGAWQYILPAGRQLPHLQSLDFLGVKLPSSEPHPQGPGRLAAPASTHLVSCCLALKELAMSDCSAELLSPLTGLTGLRVDGSHSTAEDVQAVCLLTGLQKLHLMFLYPKCQGRAPTGGPHEGMLLRLTQLRQLTELHFGGPHDGDRMVLDLFFKVRANSGQFSFGV